MARRQTKSKKRPPRPLASLPKKRREKIIFEYSRNSPADVTHVLEQLRDLELKLAAIDPRRRRWPMAAYGYGQHVTITPLDHIQARVIDLHVLGQAHTIEYDVRYFHEGKEFKVRVFEDELTDTDRRDR